MTQPTFIPVSDVGAVRPTVPTATPMIGRTKKAGLLGRPVVHGRTGQGTPGPDAGFALTLAHRALAKAHLDATESHHDIEVGVALLACKRAALVGRGPTQSDVEVVLDLFNLRTVASEHIVALRRQRFDGIGHNYFLQREFVDSVADLELRQLPGTVRALTNNRSIS